MLKSNTLKRFATMSVAVAGTAVSAFAAKEKKNVLFIVCDDLRPQLNCYGVDFIQSPNIDALASEGVLFQNSYCNIPVSGASRASLLTGLRPTENTFWKWNSRVDQDAPSSIPMNQWFKENGYVTISEGKIFHHSDEKVCKYWDRAIPVTTFFDYKLEENRERMDRNRRTGKGPRGWFYEVADVSETQYEDYICADRAIEDINKLAVQDDPFFLAVGFVRPHLPFIVPKKYWDLYDHDSIKIPDNYFLKEGNNIPKRALPGLGELHNYSGIPDKGRLSDEQVKEAIHAYCAAVSFIDAQVGRVVKALKDAGLYENTSIVLIGDHGWNLGEHGLWCKHCVMSTSLKAPMIIRPAKPKARYKCNQVVEFVDLYPTICDLAGVGKPENLEGESLLPLLKRKSRKTDDFAISRWIHGFVYSDIKWSYTEWWNEKDQTVENMLFDLESDADQNYNLADKAEYKAIVEKLSKKLRANRGVRYHQ